VKKKIEDWANALVKAWATTLEVSPPKVRLTYTPRLFPLYSPVEKEILLPEPYVVEAWMRNEKLTRRALLHTIAHEFRHHMLYEAGKPYLGTPTEISCGVWATKWTGVSKPEAMMLWKTLLPEIFGAAQKLKAPRIRIKRRLLKNNH